MRSIRAMKPGAHDHGDAKMKQSQRPGKNIIYDMKLKKNLSLQYFIFVFHHPNYFGDNLASEALLS